MDGSRSCEVRSGEAQSDVERRPMRGAALSRRNYCERSIGGTLGRMTAIEFPGCGGRDIKTGSTAAGAMNCTWDEVRNLHSISVALRSSSLRFVHKSSELAKSGQAVAARARRNVEPIVEPVHRVGATPWERGRPARTGPQARKNSDTNDMPPPPTRPHKTWHSRGYLPHLDQPGTAGQDH